jgi:hypothetical protein
MTSTNSNMRDSLWILVAVSAASLLGVGLSVGWITAVIIVVVGALLWLGYWLAVEKLSHDWAKLTRERTALDAEWEALDRTRRVREVFFDARRAMAEEAQRYWPNNPEQGGQR